MNADEGQGCGAVGGVGGGAPDFEDGEAGGPRAERANAPKAQPPEHGREMRR
jgi:hypothetical protein